MRGILNDAGVTRMASVRVSRRRKPRSGRTLGHCICPNCRSRFARTAVNRKIRRDFKIELRDLDSM